MLLRNYKEVHSKPVEMEGAKGVGIRWLISQKDGAPNFAMRVFEIQPNGFTPYHKHDWEHEVFIRDGEGTLLSDETEYKIKAGDAILIPPDEPHQFKNASDKKLEFLCLIPNKGE